MRLMRTHDPRLYLIAALCGTYVLASGQAQEPAAPAPILSPREAAKLKGLVPREWTIDGAPRQALLYVPASAATSPAPVVFAFHGHGGSMQGAARMFDYHHVWPEAIVVYMQGLNTPGRLTDPEGKKPGWQSAPGILGDRDFKFFDAVLASLKADHKVDDRRIYATGHSNGGGFTYLLWRTRGDVFAAVAPSAAAGPGAEWTNHIAALTPKPVLHLAGEKDPLVKYEWQQAGMEALRKLNGCEAEGTQWGNEWCTLYPSKTGTPVVTLIHPGGHNFPAEAPALFVKFFKEHAKP
jgi:polyhydroxybutyrate depolymerase